MKNFNLALQFAFDEEVEKFGSIAALGNYRVLAGRVQICFPPFLTKNFGVGRNAVLKRHAKNFIALDPVCFWVKWRYRGNLRKGGIDLALTCGLVRGWLLLSYFLLLYLSVRPRSTFFCSSVSSITERFLSFVVRDKKGEVILAEHGGERRFFESRFNRVCKNFATRTKGMRLSDLATFPFRDNELADRRVIFVLPSLQSITPDVLSGRAPVENEFGALKEVFDLLEQEVKARIWFKPHPKNSQSQTELLNLLTIFSNFDREIEKDNFGINDIYVFVFCGSLWAELIASGALCLYLDLGVRNLSSLGLELFKHGGRFRSAVDLAAQLQELIKDQQSAVILRSKLVQNFKSLYDMESDVGS